MRVHLGGHLSWYDPQKRSWLELPQPEPVRLLDLAARLGLPAAEISIAALNGRAVNLAEAIATDDDRVEFFSPLGGG
jgi:sulfur carrier protein ThiS